jgi:cytidylate kinase
VDDGRQYTVLADGRDITWSIRKDDVEAGVSQVSAYRGVRQALVIQQRRVSDQGRVVMVGRDIGTIVLPNADLKIFLNACIDERAKRRYRELIARGQQPNYEEVVSAMRRRDEIDSKREVSPLVPAEDAFIVDTSHLTIEQVLDAIEELVNQQAN